VIGAGIVGLATAHELIQRYPHATVTVLEKEDRVAAHQTGHNSGVIHAGVYYRPGSLKASLCRAGSRSMIEFCRANDLPVLVCGKLIVATSPEEIPRLRVLFDRATTNGIGVSMVGPDGARDIEPQVSCVEAMHVPSTAIVDFGQVARRLAELVEKAGGSIRLGARVTGLRRDGDATGVATTIGAFRADYLINCAGLHSDRIARLAGHRAPARIIGFRGEYYELRPERRDLVRGLIYPVPDPTFPFLGVHLTRMIDGSVHAGPNAVLALAREGYSWRHIRPRDLGEALAYPGLWRLASKHLRPGVQEVRRSLSKRLFAASVARLMPALGSDDIVPAGAGVRAQAISRDGGLVDDFLIVVADRQIHVLNAPSPAATSSLEIAKHIVGQLSPAAS
jgi:L-2-hydroxyglutarate oxidase